MFDLSEYFGIAAVLVVMIGAFITYCIVGKKEKKSNNRDEANQHSESEQPKKKSVRATLFGNSVSPKADDSSEFAKAETSEAKGEADEFSQKIVDSIEEQRLQNFVEPKFQASFLPNEAAPVFGDAESEGKLNEENYEKTMVLGGVAVQGNPDYDEEKTVFISKEDMAPILSAAGVASVGGTAKNEAPAADPNLVLMPEKPLAFGYKMAWLAIPNTKTAAVLSSLGLNNIKPANWTNGLTTAYEDKKALFVSPVLNGWVLVIGRALWNKADLNQPIKDIDWFRDLSEYFENYCYFSTMRGLENHGWVKVENGALVRAYGVSGELEEVVWCFGNPTKEELALNPNLPSPAEVVANPVRIKEQDVLQMAAMWSIDTTFTNLDYGADLGFVGKIG